MRTESPAAADLVDQPLTHLRWLAIPVFILIMALVGFAVASEGRDDFEERQDEQAGHGEGDGNGGGQGESNQDPADRESEPQSSQSSRQQGQGASDTIIVHTEDGDVVVQVDKDGNPVALVPIETDESGNLDGDYFVPSDTGRVLAPNQDGNVVGVRATKQGRIEAVDADEITSEDFLFRESTERLALLRPDGSVVTLEPTSTFELKGSIQGTNRDNGPAVKLSETVIEQTGIDRSANLVAKPPADHPGIAIETGSGSVRFDLDREGNLVAESGTGLSRNTTPTLSSDGSLVGLRVSRDRKVERIKSPDLVGAQDFRITVEINDLVIERPDGQRILLTPSPNDESLAARKVSVNESNRKLKTNDTILIATGSGLPSKSKVADDGEPMSLQTENGLVRLDLDKDGNLVADQPNRENITILDPAEASAIRINENGEFEVVPADEIRSGDAVLQPNGDGGFDLARPDGTRVEFRPDGEGGGMTATEVSADGTETELTPKEDGSVTLKDGTEVGAIDQPEDSGPIERLLESTSEMPWLWLLGGFTLLALLSIGTAVYLHRNRPEDPFDYSQLVSQGQIPRDRFEEFLVMLRADPDPTRAVRLGFSVAENGLGGVPRKNFTETPFEWQKRVAAKTPNQAGPIEVICDLFARARFAPGDSLEHDRSEMIAQLRLLESRSNGGFRPDQQSDDIDELANWQYQL